MALLDSLDQTYRATRSEVRALRLAHESGWRSAALERIGGLVRLGSRNLNRRELREDAIACLAEIDVRIQSRIGPPRKVGGWHLKFSPDGRTVAANEQSGGVSLWDLIHDRELAPIPKALEFSPFAFHPGGALAVASAPGPVTFHPLAPGQPTFPAIEGQGHALNLGFSRSGDRLAVAWGNVDLLKKGVPATFARVTVSETATGKTIRTIAIPNGTPISYKVPLALSPDGDSVATTGPNFEVRVYPVGDAGDPVVLGTLDTSVCAIAFHPDGQSLAACGKRFAAIWDLRSRSERVRIINPSERGLWDLAFSPDGRYLATAGGDAVGRLWDARSGRELAAVPAQTGNGLSVAFSPLGDRFAVGGSWVSVLAIEGGRERRTETSQTNVGHDLVFDPARPLLFHCGGDRNLYEWRLDEPAARPIYRLMGALNPSALRLAPGGREFVVGWHPYNDTKPGADYSLRVWARDDPQAQRRLVGPRGPVDSIALDGAGRRIAAGSRDGGLYVWDFRGGTLLHREGLGAMAPSLHFLGDSGLLVAAGSRLLLLSAEDGAVRRELVLPQGVADFVVTPDRKEALVATVDGAIHKVLLPGLEIQRSQTVLDPSRELRMAISPDGSLVAVTTRNRTRALLLDLDLGPIAMMPGHESGRLNYLVFDPKGKYFAFGDSDTSLWDLDLIRDDLAPLGLAWHQATPRVVASAELAPIGERPGAPVPIIGVLGVDPAESEAQRLLNSGEAASQQGRITEAVVDLERAGEIFRALRKVRPDDPRLASQHGSGLGWLSNALRASKRSVEALAREREGIAALESLKTPNPTESYNTALAYARLSADLAPGAAGEREELEARAVRHLRRAISGSPARYLAIATRANTFRGLRGRADFRGMVADASFPSDPFAQPSPLALFRASAGDHKTRGESLIAEGRTLEAIPHLASAWEGNPGDSILLLRVATLRAWFHRDAELAATCRKARDFASGTGDAGVADAAAKSSGLRPPDDPTYRAATLALARSAYELGKDSGDAGWFRMGLGIAEYRAGHDEAAAETLRTLIGNNYTQISDTSAFYLAMTLSRQGKDAEARRVASEALSRMTPLPPDESNPLAGDANHDDLILWMACKEATALLKIDPGAASRAGPKGK